MINPSSIVSYSECIWDLPHKKTSVKFIDVNLPIEEQSKFLNSTRKNDGTLSKHATRKMSKAIEYLIITAREKTQTEKVYGKRVTFKTAFITLTLPSTQIHSDNKIISSCLNSFLTECRKVHELHNYVWRAERQKNGNIHFHILIDTFIPWNDIRDRWNRIVNKLGYIDKFQEKNGKKIANSTDIHSTKKVRNLKAYLTKYMTKGEQKQMTPEAQAISTEFQSGHIWGCNHNLSQVTGLNLEVDGEIDEEMKKLISSGQVRRYDGNYFTVYYFDYHLMLKVGATNLFKYFSDYLYEKLRFSEQLQISA